MVDLYIDPSTGDIALEDNQIRFTSNNAELTRQRVDTSLNTYRGEWFYNILEGIPYLENDNNPIQLLGKANAADFDSYVKQIILSKPFVKSIKQYRSELNPYTSTLTINTIFDAGEDTEIQFNRTV